VKLALFAGLEAKPGKEKEVADSGPDRDIRECRAAMKFGEGHRRPAATLGSVGIRASRSFRAGDPWIRLIP